MSLAAALGADAESIRRGAGLQRELTRVMEISLRRDATKAELAKLPSSMQRLFVEYYSARRTVEITAQAVQDENQNWWAACEERRPLEEEHISLFAFAVANATDVDAQSRFRACSQQLRAVNDRVKSISSSIAEASKESLEALRRYQAAGLQVMALMMQVSQ